MSYDHFSEAQLLLEVLRGKPQNYALAYLATFKKAGGGSEGNTIDVTFNRMLKALDEADKTHPAAKQEE